MTGSTRRCLPPWFLLLTLSLAKGQDSCLNISCLNGSTCEGTTATCVCPSGYTGDRCQTEITCMNGHYFNTSANICQPCPRGTYSGTFGRPSACFRCLPDSAGYPATTPAEGSTDQSDCFFKPSINIMKPIFGPMAGGTNVYVNITHQDNRHIIDYNIAGGVCDTFSATDDNTTFICRTSNVSKLTRGPVKLLFDDEQIAVSPEHFHYQYNPSIRHVDRWNTFISGGLIMRVTGVKLTSVARPQLQVTRVTGNHARTFYSNCTVRNSTYMVCYTPNLGEGLKHVLFSARRSRGARSLFRAPAASGPGDEAGVAHAARRHVLRRRAVSPPTFNDQDTHFYAGFLLDGVEEFKNLSDMPVYGQLTVYPDPEYERFPEIDGVRRFYPYDEEFLHLKGFHLNYACRETDIKVTIGLEECMVTFLATNQLSCRPPDVQPRVEDTGYGPGNVPRVTVYVGTSLTYVIGYLAYANRTEGAAPPVTDGILGAIVAVAVGFPAVIIFIVVLVVRRRREGWEKRNRLSTGSSALSNDYYEIQRMAARTSEYQLPIDYLPGYSRSPDGSLHELGFRGRHMSTSVTPPGTPGMLSLSSGESRLPLDSYYGMGIGAISRNSLPLDVLSEMTEDMKITLGECRVDSSRLVIGEVVGQGYFGKVFRGQLLDDELSSPKTVAVKTVQGSQCSVQDLTSFLEEAIIMKDFRHQNVLTLMGVVLKDDKPFVILPFMEHGDLKSYIREPSRRIKVRELLGFGVQIVDGMAYLAHQKFVHRDLATRNCMFNSALVVKIADFGLSRDIYKSDYYRIEDKHRPLPVKWMAVESLTTGVFSSKSDVWSFGVLLWELLTRGCSPYPDVDSFNIKNYVLSGRRLSQPTHAPDKVYEIMRQCWMERPEERPGFDEIYNSIREILDHHDAEHHPEYLRLVNVD